MNGSTRDSGGPACWCVRLYCAGGKPGFGSAERLCAQVLKLWAKRDLLPATSLQPEIERLQERLLQHSAANAAKAATDSLLKQANDIMNNGGNSVVR